ncbi:hypothetical protein UA08_06282 [Talaromyces atroroseus]|uniref:C2H2-type domain-containing protein n=1 Tax=Talaromyces atroroseus TaxID=1441469 RepID=A0A225AUR0_TALAT|nr:hypothetical protein UA08_06282 [Talaromyces atroroseus]OKL58696.1 hypothetical protein UA08_06282 [Talaromyces atroroseus]
MKIYVLDTLLYAVCYLGICITQSWQGCPRLALLPSRQPRLVSPSFFTSPGISTLFHILILRLYLDSSTDIMASPPSEDHNHDRHADFSPPNDLGTAGLFTSIDANSTASSSQRRYRLPPKALSFPSLFPSRNLQDGHHSSTESIPETPSPFTCLTKPPSIFHEPDLTGFPPISANTSFADPGVSLSTELQVPPWKSSVTSFDSVFPTSPLQQPYQNYAGSTSPQLWHVGPKEDDISAVDATLVLPPLNPTPSARNNDVEDECGKQSRYSLPECRRLLSKGLKAHMLIEHSKRPERCPIATCEYHLKGFKCKHDKDRHTLTHFKGTMICGFCPGSGSAADKSFNKVDIFKHHLSSAHGVQETFSGTRSPSAYGQDTTGKCSICSRTFRNAQYFYEHLDDCTLHVIQQESSQAFHSKEIAEGTLDEAVKHSMEKRRPLDSSSFMGGGDHIDVKDHDDDDDFDFDFDFYNPFVQSGRSSLKPTKSGAKWPPISVLGPTEPDVHRAAREDINRDLQSLGIWADMEKAEKHVHCTYDDQLHSWKDQVVLDGNMKVHMHLRDTWNNGTNRDVHVTDSDIIEHKRDSYGSLKLQASSGEAEAEAAEMDLNDRMEFWASKTDAASREIISVEVPSKTDKSDTSGSDLVMANEELEERDDRFNGGEMQPPILKTYRNVVVNNSGYRSLLANVKRERLLTSQQPNAMETIKERILDILSQSASSNRQRLAGDRHMTFRIEWDPKAFILNQKYSEKPEDAIERAIVVTGTITDAQALTCRQYLCQTWPSSGLEILQLVKDIVRFEDEDLFHRVYTLSNQANIAVLYRPSKMLLSSTFTVDVTGSAHVIVEIGEQLAWLGAALQWPDSDGISSVKTQIQSQASHSICISFHVETESEALSTVNGNCWHNLFRSPVVVEGFPIPRRRQVSSTRGLEIPLNMMAGLARARRVNKFRSRTVLKGHFAMLLPVGQIGDIVMWHLIHDKKGGRISYNDSLAFDTVDIDLATLEKARHVLGWCSEMKFYGGAADARYDIRASRLPRAQSSDGIMAESALCHGQRISGGHPFSRGHRDIPIHISHDGFIPRLKWMSKKAWLVNGTAALLHLVRASLEHDKTDPFHSVFLFDTSEMTEALKAHHPHSAIHVLIDQRNLSLKVYPNKEGYITFEHRVEHFYDVLEKFIDSQVHALGKYGNQDISRAHLVGWDFNDIIASRDPIYPRLATLDHMGKSWVDFSHSIHAIALFGRGFGEIIEPVGAFCSYWAKLPKDRSYLAACVSDIKEIIEAYGDPSSMPTQLTHNIIWHHIEQPFKTCMCHSSHEGIHSDVTQVLLPPTISLEELHRPSRIVNLDIAGAVIFGFNNGFKWYWGDTGDPTTQQQKLDDGSRRKSFASSPSTNDSGLGKSLSSFSSQDKDSSISLSSHQDSADDSIPSRPIKRQKVVDHSLSRTPAFPDEDLSFACRRYTWREDMQQLQSSA